MNDLSGVKNIGLKGGGSALGTPANSIDALRNRESTALDFKKSLADSIATAQTGLATNPTVATGALQKALGADGLKFSAHAVDRMKSRGISFAPDMMKGIESAVSRAAAKGSKDTLVLAGDNALIVSVKNNTVVTVMDKNAMRENVFTNIDSTVIA